MEFSKSCVYRSKGVVIERKREIRCLKNDGNNSDSVFKIYNLYGVCITE